MTTSDADPARILVVDDTPTNVSVLLEVLSGRGYKVLVARDGGSALEQAQYARPDLILLDVMMPGMDGFETCRRLKADPGTGGIPVIFMTALGEIEDKVRGFEAGAADYVVKPFQHEEVLARVRTHLTLRALQQRLANVNRELEQAVAERTGELRAALRELETLKNRLQNENSYLRQEISEQADHGQIVGRSPAIREVMNKVDVVAPTGTTVLIRGETGTGKELIARALHECSPRRDRPMVKLNCAAISAGLVESELFGHVKGAFTGASDRRVGRFELADRGTIFLDEVSELPLDTQTKLLRVLQEGEFEPVGSSRTVAVDVRVIAATNRDLHADVASGRFRADLYYRLSVFPIEVPPLRARPEDIPDLARHFLERFARRLGKSIRDIDAASLARLSAYDWPGNIRDLQNTIERAAILTRGELLYVDGDLGPAPPSCFAIANAAAPGTAATPAPGPAPIPTRASTAADTLTLQEIERRHFIEVLRRTRGVIEGPNGAARLLDLKPSTARFRIRKLGITKIDYLAD
ncbi:MAG: sigma-54-dependent Fis family transcriptional regulator [Gammaproteobacteria bacterium]|nr:sigma-54-dependent Fis family transcriptional regulator [Gammaproteobacteria bacterium]